jgi:hypothetical protein
MPELPAESRIVSRVDGGNFVIVIPRLNFRPPALGWIAAVAFLAVTFTAQGIVTRSAGWSAAGLIGFLFAGAMLLGLFVRVARQPRNIEIVCTPRAIEIRSRIAGAVQERRWEMEKIREIGWDGGSVVLHQGNGDKTALLPGGVSAAEGAWIVEQIRRRIIGAVG